MRQLVTTAGLVASLAVSFISRDAEACGCFAPPDPTVPVVQAGERILFAVDNGVVTAHIQIQYAGDAADFGWLLPLPSVPELKLGSEELFTQLIASTQPEYRLTRITKGSCGGSGIGLFAQGAPTSLNREFDSGNGGPLVTQSSIGPYDYAVLRADSKEEMFNWLRDNRYFIPVGTDETVGPYINPGAYFLALKLKSGKSAGDIQPVVLTYPSQLPMIPIVLTSVAAQPNMGIQVWMAGAGRAIPRNYNHVVINDAQIDWVNQAQNYNDVIIRAVAEAPEKHAFVTEYAGTSAVMAGRLTGNGRFGTQATLASMSDPASFVEYLFANGFTSTNNTNTNIGFNPTTLLPSVRNLVIAAVPKVPTSLTDEEYLSQLRYELQNYRSQNPNWEQPAFDSQALAAQLFELVVQPLRDAQTLIDSNPKLTRLYTTLSPQDMTRDPVFSFNPELPDVSNIHTATLTIDCGFLNSAGNSPAKLVTEQGWTFSFSNANTTRDLNVGPAALRIETLREEGAPEVLTDNTPNIIDNPGCGCTSADPATLGLMLLGLSLLRRRRN